jgi:hypothetical protein
MHLLRNTYQAIWLDGVPVRLLLYRTKQNPRLPCFSGCSWVCQNPRIAYRATSGGRASSATD